LRGFFASGRAVFIARVFSVMAKERETRTIR
jgi:hypothetical protein